MASGPATQGTARGMDPRATASAGEGQARVARALDVLQGLGASAMRAAPLVFGILAIALPLILMPVTREQANTAPGLYAVAVLIVVLAAVRLALLISDERPKLIAGTFWMFLYISAGVVPIAQLHTQVFGFLISTETLVSGGLMFLVAGLAFEAGHIASRRGGGDTEAVATGPQRVLTRPRLIAVSLVTIAASAVYVQTVGGVAVFFGSRADYTEAISESGLRSESSQVVSALLSAAAAAPALVALLGWLIVVRDRENRLKSDFAWLAVILAVNLVVNNPLPNARYWTLTVLVGLAYALPGMGRTRFTWAVVGGILGALVIFPYSDVTRYSEPGEAAAVEVVPISEKIASKDYDQVVMSANGAAYVNTEGFTLGHQTGSALLFWVPRSVWPAKGYDTGVMLGEHFDGEITNLSSPLPLEIWIDYGWVGLALGFVGIGFVARRLEDRLDFNGPVGFGRTSFYALLLPLVAGYSFILMRGPLLQAMGRGMALVLACWFATAAVDKVRERGVKGTRYVRPISSHADA